MKLLESPRPTMDDLPDARRKQARRQRWVMLGIGLALLLVALGLWSRDEDAPEVSDLMPTPRKLADDQNAYLFIEQAAKLNNWDYLRLEMDEQRVVDAMLKGEKWDNTKAASWLASTEKIWPLLAQAAALPSGQAPLNDPAFHWSSNEFSNLSRLSIIQGWSQYYAGQPEAGIETLLTSLRAAHHLETSRGTEFTYFSGYNWSRITEKTLVSMADHSEISPAALRRALDVLLTVRSDNQDLAQTLRAIGRDDMVVFADFAHHKGNQSLSALSWSRPLPAIVQNGINWPLLFKPYQSQRLLADEFRSAIKLSNADGATIYAWTNGAYERLLGGNDWRVFNPNNLVGRVLLSTGVVALPYIVVETHFDEQSRHSASEAFFALRIYFAEHGELPARLDQLVPAYLPAVPLDFYDRQPIRYSHDNFAVWSVGFRHFNVTSINPDPEETQNEIYYRLDFAAPPRPVPVEDPPESSP